MQLLTESNSHWLEYDGLTVQIDGIAHKITARSSSAIYPYAHESLSVTAEEINKNRKGYQDVKRHLGDDWLLDVFEIEACSDVERQCREQVADTNTEKNNGNHQKHLWPDHSTRRLADGERND